MQACPLLMSACSSTKPATQAHASSRHPLEQPTSRQAGLAVWPRCLAGHMQSHAVCPGWHQVSGRPGRTWHRPELAPALHAHGPEAQQRRAEVWSRGAVEQMKQ
eukprot:scaffold72161_cov23-Tisochrysis_lutea.AAC.2